MKEQAKHTRPFIEVLVVTCLAATYTMFFNWSKHSQVARVNPFSNDPYDAAASFALAIILIALVVIWAQRALVQVAKVRSHRSLPRLILMIPLTIVTMMMIDAAALLRYVSTWTAFSTGWQLAGALGALLVLSLITFIVLAPQNIRRAPSSVTPTDRWAAFAVLLLVMFLYPAELRLSIVGALITVIAGAAVLFVGVRAGMFAVWPDNTGHQRIRYWWKEAVLVGLLFGVAVAAVEGFTEGVHSIMVPLFFILTGVLGICLAYFLLAKPLALYSVIEQLDTPK